MRNFSKTLISMAAVMAVGSAMAAGAMAGELGIKSDAIKTDGTITIESGVETGKSQYTLLVVKGATGVTVDADKDDYTKVDETTIKQIDQNDEGKAFSSVVLGKDLADGNYKVMVGNNDGTVDTGYFTLSSAPVVETKDILVGDTDLTGAINIADNMWMSRYNAKYTDRIGQIGTSLTKADGKGSYIVGDTDVSGAINIADNMWMSRYNAKYTDRIGMIGTTITVIVE